MGGTHDVGSRLMNRMVNETRGRVDPASTFHDAPIGSNEDQVVDGDVAEGNAVAGQPEMVQPLRVARGDVAVTERAVAQATEHPVRQGRATFAVLT